MSADTSGRCPEGHRQRPHSPCGICRRAETLAAVITADASLDVDEVTAAFDTAVTTAAAVRTLAAALAENPDALSVGAPPVVGRLVTELVAAGSTTFTLPACSGCGRVGRPLTATTEGGMCRRCAHRRTATVCDHCEAVKPVAGRTADGQPLCERCRRRYRGQRPCGICGETASIAVRARQGQPDVCVNCYRLPEAVCVRCHRMRPCNFADGDRPICKQCTPRATVICAHCGHDRPPTARWPEGPVCEPCYRAALSRRGHCHGCGQQRRLVDPSGPNANRCSACSGVTVPGGHVCSDCGTEDRLFEQGRCVRCALDRRAAELLGGDQPSIAPAFVPIHNVITAAPQPYSVLNWLRQGTGAQILSDLAAGRLALSHEALDTHPRPSAAAYLRRMLVAHGLLADRDEELARLQRWVADLVDTIGAPSQRRLVTTYATWRVLRRLRHRAERTPSPWTATRHAKTQLSAAAGLLAWLAQRHLALNEVGQAHIDTWLTTSPGAYQVRDFLAWAAQHGHCQPLTVPASTHGNGTSMDPDARWAILARLLHDPTIDLTDRVAGCLLLCYAQPLTRITAITVDQVTRRVDETTIRFGSDDIVVPQPLATLLADLIDTPRPYVGVGAPATSPWLFPGHLPGRPLTPARLGQRLGTLGIDARAGRRAALIHLAAQLPAPVIADLLHLTPGTAVRWVNNAGGDWSRYAASLAAERHHQPSGIGKTTTP